MVGSGPPAVPLISMLSTRIVPANQRKLFENTFYMYAFFNKVHKLTPWLTCKSVSKQKIFNFFYLAWYRKCSVSKRQKKIFVMLFVNDILRRWSARQRFKLLVRFTLYFLFPFKSISVFLSLSITSHRSYHWILSWTKENSYNNRGWYFSSLSKTSDMKKDILKGRERKTKEKIKK